MLKGKKILYSAAAALLLFCLGGCSSSKEILLETSVQEEAESEEAAQETSSGTAQENAEQTQDADAETTDEDAIYVYICGAVENAGVYRMQAGDRVCDLVEAAGGLTADADEAAINQAAVLSDEQMVYIYSVDEEAEIAASGTASSSGSSESAEGKVNINTADLTELTTLSGIGEAKAQNIINYREENGDFSSIEDIMNVNGIKEGTYAQIKDDICV